jgi:4-hydroxy-3-methylbut-2-enyl diphosphate reductase IspH
MDIIQTLTQEFNLKEEQVKNHHRIAITSGASTPTVLTNQVIETLKHFASTQQFIYPEKNSQLI